jgi:hypothetical protein
MYKDKWMYTIERIISITILAAVISPAYAQPSFVEYHNQSRSLMPPGSYPMSCFGMRLIYRPDGTLMTATCVNDRGIDVSTSLENANLCNFVENIHGVLTCTGGFN